MALLLLPGRRLSDADPAADLEDCCRLDSVQAAEGIDRSAVVYGYAAQCIAGFNCVPAHCLSFGVFLLVFFVILDLVFEILLVVAVYTEIFLLQYEQAMTEFSFLEVYEPLRIECVTLVSCLEVEVRTGRTSGRAAISYDITGIDPVVFLDESLLYH